MNNATGIISTLIAALTGLAASGPWGIAAMGVGAAGLLAGLFFLIRSLNKKADSLDSAAASEDAGNTGVSMRDQVKRNQDAISELKAKDPVLRPPEPVDELDLDRPTVSSIEEHPGDAHEGKIIINPEVASDDEARVMKALVTRKVRSMDSAERDLFKLYNQAVYRADWVSKIRAKADTILKYRSRYEAVGQPLGIPFWVVGLIHAMENGSRFDGHLHNGDPLSARTRHVPAGRPTSGKPPFTWEFSARDALKGKKLDKISNWDVAGSLKQFELYNGLGYRKRGVVNPYLFSGTSVYRKGKYVADGRYDANKVSAQVGIAPIMMELRLRGIDIPVIAPV